MLSVSSGHSASYLTESVGAGRENYYTGAVAAGEPPGRWSGRGAEAFGLAGEVDAQDMTALYERFIDPLDENFGDPAKWDEAETLGHTGRVYKTEEQIYAAALAKEPGADAERRAALLLEAGKKARKNVAFHDATFSVQKSVTVLHTAFEAQEVQARGAAEAARGALAEAVRTGDRTAVHRCTQAVHRADQEAAAWSAQRQAVEDAIWAGNNAALEYLSDKAGYARVGHHGGAAGRWDDAHDWTVASFFQHDSRDHDPQLHIHNAILNRVQGSDGKWRTVDGQALYRYRGAAAAVGERVMEQHITQALGVRFATRPDGEAREIVGIDQAVMDLFSSRRRAITTKTAGLVAAFEAKFDRQPNALELDRLQRTATLATRKAKSHDGETVEQRLERWDQQLRAEVAGGLRQVADTVLSLRDQRPEAARFKASDVIETALADLQAGKAAWRAADLTRAISDALPDQLGAMSPDKVGVLLDRLTDQALRYAVPLDAAQPGEQALPEALRRADGTSAYQAPGNRLYATPDHIHTERVLSASSVVRGAPAADRRSVDGFLSALTGKGIDLGVDQAAAVRGILTSGAKVETLIGPAGTGKSYVVGTLAHAWHDASLWNGQRRNVVGLAASQIATDVLAGEGLTARNITRWLTTQQRLTDVTAHGEDRAWALRDGDLVVVDESAMANTADLAAIHEHCTAAGAKLLLVGDHRQLAAVGAAGGMELVLAGGVRHELSETRRFTNEWEGAASLRLRDGDESALTQYHQHGRLLDGGAVEEAERSASSAWLADTLDGYQSLLIVDSNEQAARLAAQLRARLVRFNLVDDEDRVPLGMQGTYAGAGDVIQARRNEWGLEGYEGNLRGPINRERYKVLATLADGGLRVAPITGRVAGDDVHGDPITLPGRYVAEHVTLGYASTVHAAQGLTVDTSHVVAGGATSANALYVGMTRGRHANTAHVVTRAAGEDVPTGTVNAAVHRSPRAVLSGAFETTETQLSALATFAESQAEADAVRTPVELLTDAIEVATAGRTARWLDQLVTDGHLSADQRSALAAEDGAATLTTLLRRVELAGHDPQAVLADAVARRGLDDARQITNVIHRRITNSEITLDPAGDSYTTWIPTLDDQEWDDYLTTLAKAAESRRDELGAQVARDLPQWAVEEFGQLPTEDDTAAKEVWVRRASAVAAHRELVGHDDPATALGTAPKPGQVEVYASWRAAWRALGREEAARAEAEMSTGQLRVRVRAYDREKAWAPPYVVNELAGTRQSADRHRRDATLREAEAATADNDTTRQQLRDEAEQARALAEALDQRAAELDIAAEARAQWYLHTTETRLAAERATAELSARQTDAADTEPDVTAEELLAADQAATRAEDTHRPVTDEHDLTEIAHQRDTDQLAATPPADTTADAAPAHDSTDTIGTARQLADVEHHTPPADLAVTDDLDTDNDTDQSQGRSDAAGVDKAGASGDNRHQAADVAEPVQEIDTSREAVQVEAAAPRDIRQETAHEEPVQESDTVRVPTADETAESVRRAQRALIEIRQREAAEHAHASDEASRDDDLARWHTNDTTRDDTSARAENTTGPALGLSDDAA